MIKAKLLVTLGLLFSLHSFSQLADSLSRVVRMEGAVNFRDVGAYTTKDNKVVVTDRIFRSADISKLTDNDLNKLSEKRIHTVIDFRGTKECAAAPDRLLPNTDYTLCPAGSENLPTAADMTKMLKEGDFLMTMYGQPSMQYYGERYKPLFDKLKVLPDGEALLYHCTAGRDRTGMATALVLYILDVPMQTIEDDYLASNVYLKSTHTKMYQSMATMAGMTIDEIEKKFELRAELLQNFFATIIANYGSVENFLQQEMGVNEVDIILLRAKYTK